MAGPRFRDDEPVYNVFDKPVICTGESDPPAHCCSLCEAWTQCLQRVPWRLDLNGFILHELFNYIRFNGLACCIGDNGAIAFTGEATTPTDAHFAGTYVGEPKRWDLTDFGVPNRAGDAVTCANDINATCGSHFSRSYKTVSTPAGQLTPITRVYLDFNAACRLNDEDEPVVVLEVYLVTWYEQIFGCVSPCPDSRAITCHKILESAEIPVTLATTWADFLNVPLLPLDQGDDETPLNRFEESQCHIEKTCDGDDCPDDDDECCWPGVAPPVEYVNTDPGTPNYGNTASVLAQSCDYVLGCHVCQPEEPRDRTKPLTPATIDFTAEPVGGGCYKTFTAIAPECLGEMQWFWSFGKTGEVVSHLIETTDYSGITDYLEEITLIGVDSRGCIYFVTKEVSCGCCPGVSGSLDATPDGCSVELCASVTNGGGACTGLDAFIEIQWLDGGTPEYPADCFCDAIDPDSDDPPCGDKSATLKDGQCLTLTSGWRGYRWRVWDRVCGCPGPWTTVENSLCDKLSFVGGGPTTLPSKEYVNVCGDTGIPGCGCFLYDYHFSYQWKAYYCGERVFARVRHGSVSDQCDDGTIINPGDPIEDQIAEAEYTVPNVEEGAQPFHCHKAWLQLGTCADPIGEACLIYQDINIASCCDYGDNDQHVNCGGPLSSAEWCELYG